MRYETLSTGARKCLDLFRWFHNKTGACFPRVGWIAKRLKCSERSVSRWTGELAAAGAIRKRRRGRKSSQYEIVAVIEPAQGNLFPVDNPVDSVENFPTETVGGRIFGRANGRTNGAVSITDLEDFKNQNQAGLKTEPRRATDRQWSDTELAAVQNSVSGFGESWDAKPKLVARLERIGNFYNRNGFQCAAELERVRRQVERRPSTEPESSNWFCAVLEARLKRATGYERKIVARAQAEPVAQSEAQLGYSGLPRFDPGSLVADLAAGKDLLGAVGWKHRAAG